MWGEDSTYQLTHQGARGEVGLQEGDEVPPWHQERDGEDGDGRLGAHRFLEGVETGGREDKAADVGDV